MKSSPSAAFVRCALGLALLGIAPAVRAQVSSPATRTATVEAARKLLAAAEAVLPAGLVDPFHPTTFGEQASTTQASDADGGAPRPGQRSERELLMSIAGAIKPSGYFVLGGEPTLVFGQKRVKAGGTLSINFEGADHTLEVTAIDRTSFTLRLNREEYTRPIK